MFLLRATSHTNLLSKKLEGDTINAHVSFFWTYKNCLFLLILGWFGPLILYTYDLLSRVWDATIRVGPIEETLSQFEQTLSTLKSQLQGTRGKSHVL